MTRKKVIAICLDALDAELCSSMIEEGKLPGLAELISKSASFSLEHGPRGLARYTGLTWEHFSSGKSPESSRRGSVICFDKDRYSAYQQNATQSPFVADTDVRTLVFDVPYFKLEAAPEVTGIVGWGGHDTGCELRSQPSSLLSEIESQFGQSPDNSALNTMVYPDKEAVQALGDYLVSTAKRRTEIINWLLTSKYADFELALLAYGESHDGIELLAHGVLPNHPLHHHKSAAAAKTALESVYETISDCVSRLVNAHSDATFVVFTMHGMGVNDTDVPTMVLLPELAYRYSTGRTLFHPKPAWLEATTPSLSLGEDWNAVVLACYRHTARDIMHRKLRNRIQRTRSAIERRMHPQEMVGHSNALVEARYPVGWMPAMQYQPYWHKMDVIGVPAFFDGRLRVNLEGREAAGTVSIEKFTQVLDEFEAVLRNCKDMITGEPVVKELSRPGGDDPFSLSSTQADIHILWNGSPMGFKHPELGIIGPAPWRRMGGHSGTLGALHILGTSLEPGFFGVRSSFDVAATVADLVGIDVSSVDGESVLDHSRSSPRA